MGWNDDINYAYDYANDEAGYAYDYARGSYDTAVTELWWFWVIIVVVIVSCCVCCCRLCCGGRVKQLPPAQTIYTTFHIHKIYKHICKMINLDSRSEISSSK